MSSVIKQPAAAASVKRVAFNLQDISQQANNYLDQVRLQAAQIVVEAQKQAEAVRRKAEEDGKQAALRAAEKVLDQKVGAKLDSLLPALKQVIQELHEARQSWLQYWEKGAIEVACAIAEKITRHPVNRKPEVPLALLREALEMAAGSPQIEIQLNPADLETIGAHTERLLGEFARVGTTKLLQNPAIEAGSCRVETPHGAIDQQFSAQLARIEAELTAGNSD
jgi:flagellar biosynthesis/type III secretory pathway protein FliH